MMNPNSPMSEEAERRIATDLIMDEGSQYEA